MLKEQSAAYYTLGCKLNFTETSAIQQRLEAIGCKTVDFGERADYYVINTCSVTDNADKKCRTIIRQAKRQAPQSKVIVVGCYAQLQAEQIAEIPGVDLVLGAAEKFNLVNHLSQLQSGDYSKFISGEIESVDFYIGAHSKDERTRTFLKVQDGCDYGCAFCTIPLARGKSRSASIDAILKQVDEIAASDVKEVVLTGVNIGDFGKAAAGSKEYNSHFIDLIRELDTLNTIERFRISSIEPNLLTEEIIDFVAASKHFMPHFHIPLQSGSNDLLKRMRRRYLSELYRERVSYIKSTMPDCCIGVDVIVGFPGETDQHFNETVEFLDSLPVSYLHVFTYSERPNTIAIEMDQVVDVGLRRNRSRQLRRLSDDKRMDFYRSFQNTSRPVLFEQSESKGMMCGFTDNYIKVELPFDKKSLNQIVPVKLSTINQNGIMSGSIAELAAPVQE